MQVTFRAQVALSCTGRLCILVALVCLTLFGLQTPALAPVTTESWTDSDATKTPRNDNWSDSNNWSSGVVPNGSNYSADIPLLGFPFTSPTQDISITLENLTVEPGTKDVVADGVSLTLTGQSLVGGLLLNSAGKQTALNINNTVTYTSTASGNCCLLMMNKSLINGSGTLINQGTIGYGESVAGNIGTISGLTLQNHGTLYSGQNSTLKLAPNSNWTNPGTIQSANPQFGCLPGQIKHRWD